MFVAFDPEVRVTLGVVALGLPDRLTSPCDIDQLPVDVGSYLPTY